MQVTKRYFCTALLGGLLAVVSQTILANAGNILNDANFELKLPPEKGGWILFDGSQFSSEQARSGNKSVYNWGFSRTIPSPPFLLGIASGSYQEFSADPGSRWRMTGYAVASEAIRGASAFGILQLSFFDDSGNDLGTVETANDKNARAKTSNQVNGQSPAGEWIFLDTGIVTAPKRTSKIHAFTLFVDYSGSESSQGVYFDDLKLCTFDSSDGVDCD